MPIRDAAHNNFSFTYCVCLFANVIVNNWGFCFLLSKWKTHNFVACVQRLSKYLAKAIKSSWINLKVLRHASRLLMYEMKIKLNSWVHFHYNERLNIRFFLFSFFLYSVCVCSHWVKGTWNYLMVFFLAKLNEHANGFHFWARISYMEPADRN